MLALLFLTGCQKQIGVNGKTPEQRVAVYNGILAEANRSATAGVISLQKSGVLTVAQTSLILDYTVRVANTSKAVAVLQQSAGDWTVVSKQIKAVLDALSPPGDFAKWLGAGPQGLEILATLNAIQDSIRLIVAEVSR
jgi:hypothetical protein